MRPSDRTEFEIAIICALRIESDAIEAVIDEFWEEHELRYRKVPNDPNSYTLGRIGHHPVVLAYMPGMGTSSAAATSAIFRASFPNIRLGLVVGVCGGVPEPSLDDDDEQKVSIFLGDVIVSTGVTQFHFGRQYDEHIIRKDTLKDNLGRPNSEIRAFLHQIQGWRGRSKLQNNITDFIGDICKKTAFRSWGRPQPEEDKLYANDYRHKHHDSAACDTCVKCTDSDNAVCNAALNLSCEQLGCDEQKPVTRERPSSPSVHFGYIGSSDQIMMSAIHRDRIARQEKLLGFEMEGAGVWDNFPTIVVKGVCDYADSHKNNRWKKYAAVSAAACAKALLGQWRGTDKFISPSPAREVAYNERNRGRHTIGLVEFINVGKVGSQANEQIFNGSVTLNQG